MRKMFAIAALGSAIGVGVHLNQQIDHNALATNPTVNKGFHIRLGRQEVHVNRDKQLLRQNGGEELLSKNLQVG